MQLSEAKQRASSSIGVMVAMNHSIDSSLLRNVLNRKVLPYIEAKLPGHKSYSLPLSYCSLLCRLLPEHISWREVN